MSVVMDNTTVLCRTNALPAHVERTVQDPICIRRNRSTKYGELVERTQKQRSAGKETWWYTAGNPPSPMCNINSANTGMENRVLFWQQYSATTWTVCSTTQ